MTRLFITDGKDEPLKGECVYFTRVCPEQELTARNVDNVSISAGNRLQFAWSIIRPFFRAMIDP